MGNTIPHGDRLHECSATCPEYKNGPMPGRVINYQHDDGRQCILGPDGLWRHYDHPVPEPGPREVVDYKCLRDHPSESQRAVDLSSDPPSPLRTGSASEDYDRGEFGMAGLGTSMKDIMDIDNPMHPLRLGVAGVPRYLAGPDAIFMVPPQPKAILPDYSVKVSPIGVSFDFGQQGVDYDFPTEEARVIFDHLPNILIDFLESNEKYSRTQTGHDLGLKGIIPDINRKVSVLVSRLWFDEPGAGREPTSEIIDDLIGHLLLMRGKMTLESGGGTPADSEG